MKKYSKLFLILAALTAMLLSACGGAVTGTETSAGSGKPLASLIEFTGVIEAMDGNQWTVNGQVITVEPSVLRDGPFEVGDTVKVEAEVQEDGSIVVTRVEPPAANDNANTNDDNSNSGLGNSNGNVNGNDNANGNSNSNSNSNDDNSNGNSNDDNSNDDDSNGNSNDDNSNDDNSNDDDDDDDDSNSNGDDDEDDDDNSGSGGGDDD